MFNIRNTAPDVSNRFYRNVDFGGQSLAVTINEANGFTLPNCVGYANGRQNEVIHEVMGNDNYVNNDMVRRAKYIFGECQKRGRPTGFEPKVGGVMCFDGDYGHVAYVERRDGNGTGNGVLLTWSDAAVNGKPGVLFTKKWMYKDIDGKGWNFWGMPYQGCVYNQPEVQAKIDSVEPPTPPTPPIGQDPDGYMYKSWLCVIGRYGNLEAQKNECEAKGFNWEKIKKCKTLWVKWYGYYN